VTLPARPIAFGAAIAFLVFAVWTWREGVSGHDNLGPVRELRFALLAVMSSFTLAELSDKTMLATIALASDHDWAGVWVGTTVGMVIAGGLGWRWMAVIAMACIGLVAATMTTVHFMRRPQASAPIPAAAGRVG
jgi:putative Ca2+/H+ antiporter (TMEM165/GDT1 family)